MVYRESCEALWSLSQVLQVVPKSEDQTRKSTEAALKATWVYISLAPRPAQILVKGTLGRLPHNASSALKCYIPCVRAVMT